jgi:hypothetical protein
MSAVIISAGTNFKRTNFPTVNYPDLKHHDFQDHAIIRRRIQGKPTQAARFLTFIQAPTILTEHFHHFY